MLNESKVKLMTRMAMYESKQGEEDFKISSYYKKDYRSFHTIATIIWVTVGYAVAVGIGVIAFLDELMGNLNMQFLVMLAATVLTGCSSKSLDACGNCDNWISGTCYFLWNRCFPFLRNQT